LAGASPYLSARFLKKIEEYKVYKK